MLILRIHAARNGMALYGFYKYNSSLLLLVYPSVFNANQNNLTKIGRATGKSTFAKSLKKNSL